ncbi:hypothetical protein LPJ57_009298, partial [Coemansia sp. RSA 486]
VSEAVPKWKALLEETGKHKAAEAIASPSDYANLFPDFERCLSIAADTDAARGSAVPAKEYAQHRNDLFRDLLNQATSTNGAVAHEAEQAADADADAGADADDNDADEFHEASPTTEQ